jgi:hypothetical protein
MSAEQALLAAALDYARRGWRVLPLHSVDHLGECTCGSPCASPAKHPRLPDGVKGASADAAQVREWWRRWPYANVGVATGPESGVWVLDLDRAKAGEADGLAAVLDVCEYALDLSAAVETGSGGQHLWWSWPEGAPVQSRARVLSVDGVKASADTRGRGGYVVAPPSVHASGRLYRWTQEPPVEGLPACPGALLDAVRAPRRETPPVAAGGPRVAPELDGDSRAARYVEGALRRACERVAASAPGARHAALLREGETLGGWVHLGVCPPEVMIEALTAAGVAAGVPEAEAVRTARDAVAHGQERPRELPAASYTGRGQAHDLGEEEVDAAGLDWDVPDAEEDEGEGEDYVPGVGVDVAEDDPEWSGVEVAGLPRVVVNLRQMSEVLADARAVLRRLRGVGAVYARGGRMVRLEGGQMVEVSQGALTSILINAARWVKLRPPKAREMTAGEAWLDAEAEGLPAYLVLSLLGEVDAKLPQLERIVRAPFMAGGVVVGTAGYHAASRTYLLGRDHEPKRIDGVGEALEVLLEDWLGDFPFASGSDRTHALAGLLTPMLRAEIDGPVPLVMIEAPERRTGKTLLMELLTEVASGQTPNPAGWAHDDEERRKTWSMLVRRGEAVICVDNVTGRMDDDPLCRILTSGALMERLLGTQDAIDVPARGVWIATGNNALMSQDLIGRSIRVRLDSQTDTPEARQDFRHSDIKAWTRARLDLLRSAALELCEAWVRAGRPYSGPRLGKFEAWSRVVGGVLEVAGVRGFLGNREEQAEAADPERGEWRALLELWMGSQHRGAAMGAGDLAKIAVEHGLLLGVIGDGNEISRARRLGVAIQSRRGRVTRVGDVGVRIEPETGAKGRPLWRPVKDAQVHAFKTG